MEGVPKKDIFRTRAKGLVVGDQLVEFFGSDRNPIHLGDGSVMKEGGIGPPRGRARKIGVREGGWGPRAAECAGARAKGGGRRERGRLLELCIRTRPGRDEQRRRPSSFMGSLGPPTPRVFLSF